MRKVLVLLSTYNGEKYLREQLDSIVQQKEVEITVLVRDDGSKDHTQKVLEEYREKYPSMFIIEKGENVGCRMSFFWLIKKASDDYQDFDYYAFADQDDVWLEDKIISGVKALDEIDNPYKVYYCSYQMVDENLNEIPTPSNKHIGTLEEAFIFQPCLGCCMIFSRELIEKAAWANFKECDIHDTWTYRLNLALGGTVVQDMEIHMKYRQHGSNVVGSNQSFSHKWKRRLSSFMDNSSVKSRQAKEMIRAYSTNIPRAQYELVSLIANYKTSLNKKIKLVFSNKFTSKKRVHNILFKIAIITNRI